MNLVKIYGEHLKDNSLECFEDFLDDFAQTVKSGDIEQLELLELLTKEYKVINGKIKTMLRMLVKTKSFKRVKELDDIKGECKSLKVFFINNGYSEYIFNKDGVFLAKFDFLKNLRFCVQTYNFGMTIENIKELEFSNVHSWAIEKFKEGTLIEGVQITNIEFC